MKLQDLGEMGLIKLLGQQTIVDPTGVKVGIGDDTAVLETGAGTLLLATTDMLVEGEHFLSTTTTPHALGHKALAVNLSDIAAMGGVARHALVAIGIPHDRQVEEVVEIYRGMKELAKEHGVNIVGGDTVHSPQGLIINVTVLGEVSPENLALRSTAQVGDKILVTGTLGGSHAGLTVALKLVSPGGLGEGVAQEALHRHYYPQPRLRDIKALQAGGGITAANDVSDGLAKDMQEICEASDVGAILWGENIPLAESTRAVATTAGQDPIDFGLYGGEDFELILTVAPHQVERVLALAQAGAVPLTVVGEIVPAGEGITLERTAGTRTPLAPGGWDHFHNREDQG